MGHVPLGPFVLCGRCTSLLGWPDPALSPSLRVLCTTASVKPSLTSLGSLLVPVDTPSPAVAAIPWGFPKGRTVCLSASPPHGDVPYIGCMTLGANKGVTLRESKSGEE